MTRKLVPKQPEVRRRAIAAAGRYSSDRHDVSEAHDEYLAQASIWVRTMASSDLFSSLK